MSVEQTITLYYRQENSDKVYIVNLEQEPSGYRVVGFNAGRGAKLIRRDKTPKPVGYSEAKDIYDNLVNEKKSEGYTVGAAIYPATSKPVTTQANVPLQANVNNAMTQKPVKKASEKVMHKKFESMFRSL